MRIAAVFLALLIFTSCSNYSVIYLLDDPSDVQRYARSDRKKKKRKPNYFIESGGVIYELESPLIEFEGKDVIFLSGTLKKENIKFKEVRDSMMNFPKERIKNTAFTEQYVFKLSDSLKEEIILGSELNTQQIEYPIKRYKYYSRTGEYVAGGVLGGLGILTIVYLFLLSVGAIGLF